MGVRPAAMHSMRDGCGGAQAGSLIAERWLFFAQANQPQNLYYRPVS